VWKPGKDDGSESCAGIGDGEQEWDLWEFVNIMGNEVADDCALCDFRYSDLQPVGMGAFGLVWYVCSPRGENARMMLIYDCA
jgi:hypothetical protein